MRRTTRSNRSQAGQFDPAAPRTECPLSGSILVLDRALLAAIGAENKLVTFSHIGGAFSGQYARSPASITFDAWILSKPWPSICRMSPMTRSLP
jgi:hypothetical protein